MRSSIKRADITDKMVVDAYWRCLNDSSLGWPYELLSTETGAALKVTYQACERAYEHGLIECGVSLRSGWLTDTGCEMAGVTKKQWSDVCRQNASKGPFGAR